MRMRMNLVAIGRGAREIGRMKMMKVTRILNMMNVMKVSGPVRMARM